LIFAALEEKNTAIAMVQAAKCLKSCALVPSQEAEDETV
jgi:hypothetical protein